MRVGAGAPAFNSLCLSYSVSLNRPQDALNCAMSPANLAGQDRPGKIENNRMAKKKNNPNGLFFSLVSGSYLQLILLYHSH